ncbi:MAG: NHL repeat-containing protein, partial [Planctomycetes bacterium]|nr:NHL repeat-containing protein [Planctomycetota bacterium]
MLALLWVCFAAHVVSAQAGRDWILEGERLADGRSLLVDCGKRTRATGNVFLVEADGTLVHTWQRQLFYPHNAQLLSQGRLLVSDTKNNRALILDPGGNILWDTSTLSLSDGSQFNYLNDVELLENGNFLISDFDNHRVVEMDRRGNILWQFGETGVPGAGGTHLRGPHSPERLPNGNTLIADAHNDRVVEIDPQGNLVWWFGPRVFDASGNVVGELDDVRDVDVDAQGNYVVADYKNSRIVVVDRNRQFVRSFSTLQPPYDVDPLPNGN